MIRWKCTFIQIQWCGLMWKMFAYICVIIQETSFSRLLKCHSSSAPWTSSLKGLAKRSQSQQHLMVLDSHQHLSNYL